MKQTISSKKIQETVLKKDWEFSSDRRMGFHLMHCFHYCFCVDFPKLFKVKPMSSIYTIKDGVTSFFYIKDEYESLLEKIAQRLQTDKRFCFFLTDYIYKQYEMYQKYANNLKLDSKKIKIKNVIAILNKNKKIEEKMSAPFWIIFNAFEKMLTDLIKDNGVSENDLVQLSLSTKMIPLDMYHIDLYKAVLTPSKDSILNIHKKYIHMGVFDFMFNQKEVSFHRSQIKDCSKEDAKLKIKEINDEYKRRNKEVKGILLKYKNLSHLLGLFKAFADVKEWKNFLREKVNNQLKFPMQFIADLLDCSLDEVALLSYEEIEKALKSKERPVGLSDRYKSSMFIFDKQGLHISRDTLFISSFLERYTERYDSITGMIAFKGIVRGRVKIIVGENDFGKIEEGDILVASTTRPDFLPVMRKVKGFVTNEGGLLSHAAIVARELKKPCIIGTKIATKVLKDGDFVEVDAEKGVVKILKKVK